MTGVDVTFIVLGLTLATALLAPHLPIPAPAVFAAVGIGVGTAWHLVPALPAIRMPPDLVLLIFLPPLLMTAAYALPLQAFRRNLLPIGLLAVGLVLATTGIAAVIAHAYAGLGWAAAFVLGAILAPPDPVAATAVAGKTGLSHRLVVILEGEGLVNDAVAIVALGLMLRSSSAGLSSPVARLASRTVWSFLRFVSTALVFLLLGLLIGEIAVDGPGWEALRTGAILSVAVIGVRLAWMLVVPRLAALLGASGPTPTLSEQVVLGWSGMRGVVSLALALALPLSLGFEGNVDVRRTIIFLTLVVIVVTLLVQGATLLSLVERLKVGNSEREQREERAARLRARRAGMAAAKAAGKPGAPSRSVGDELGARLASGSIGIARLGTLGGHDEHRPALLRALDAQRKVVDTLRDAGRMSGALAERLAMHAVGDGARLTDAGET